MDTNIVTRSFKLPLDMDEWLRSQAERREQNVSGFLRLLISANMDKTASEGGRPAAAKAPSPKEQALARASVTPRQKGKA